MGTAYFIVLDNANSGFDPFVNGKGIAREVQRLSKVAAALGLKTPDDYVSISGAEAGSMAEEFDIGEEVETPPERWFDAEEGLAWVARLRAHLQSNPQAVKDSVSVLEHLAEYERVLSQAKLIGAKWHLSVDF